MRLKKMLAVVLTATMALGLMSGCAKKVDPNQTTAETTTAAATTAANNETTAAQTEPAPTVAATIEPCTIEFWHAMSNKQQDTLVALTEEFNSTNAYGITVNLTNQGAYGDLSTKLTANAKADTLPDLAQAYNNWLSTYSDKIVHLDNYVATFDNYDDIIEGYRAENMQYGFVSGVPFNKSTYVLFYNKSLFDELGITAPTTWDELLTVAKVIKDAKGYEAIGWDDLAGMFQAMLAQNDCGYIDENGALFNNEAGLETVTYIMNLYNNGYARLVGEDSYFSNVISNQLIGMYVGSSTGASYIKANDWELGVAPLVSNKSKAYNAAGTNIVMFTQDANKQAAAVEYLKFLTSTEATTTWAIATGYLPIRTSAYSSAEYSAFMASDKTAPAAASQSSNFISQPSFAGSYDVMKAINTKFEELILAEADPQTALDELVACVNEILCK